MTLCQASLTHPCISPLWLLAIRPPPLKPFFKRTFRQFTLSWKEQKWRVSSCLPPTRAFYWSVLWGPEGYALWMCVCVHVSVSRGSISPAQAAAGLKKGIEYHWPVHNVQLGGHYSALLRARADQPSVCEWVGEGEGHLLLFSMWGRVTVAQRLAALVTAQLACSGQHVALHKATNKFLFFQWHEKSHLTLS